MFHARIEMVSRRAIMMHTHTYTCTHVARIIVVVAGQNYKIARERARVRRLSLKNATMLIYA